MLNRVAVFVVRMDCDHFADEARARLFTVDRPRGPLSEKEDLANPPERLPEHELGSDEPGRGSSGGPAGGHRLEPQETIRETYSRTFARDIAQKLKQARVQGETRRCTRKGVPSD